jgi:uncharacterized protein YdhG (YjbR/CyaY superfamily)
MNVKPKTIDDYLAGLSGEKRAALEKLRKTLRAVVPKAGECISYRLPVSRLNGRLLLAFGATARHCAFCPMSSTTVEAHKDELKDYDTSKGTKRVRRIFAGFRPARPRIISHHITRSTCKWR